MNEKSGLAWDDLSSSSGHGGASEDGVPGSLLTTQRRHRRRVLVRRPDALRGALRLSPRRAVLPGMREAARVGIRRSATAHAGLRALVPGRCSRVARGSADLARRVHGDPDRAHGLDRPRVRCPPTRAGERRGRDGDVSRRVCGRAPPQHHDARHLVVGGARLPRRPDPSDRRRSTLDRRRGS